jgi:hypothetical protein
MVMVYDRKKIFEQAKEAAQDINNEINTIHEAAILKLIKEKKLMRFDHIFGHFTGCSRATAYNHNLDKLDSIKEALESNRAKGVDYLLQKWIAGNNSVLQIAAMRLICTSEEHRLLNQNYTELTGKNGKDLITDPITIRVIDNKDDLNGDTDNQDIQTSK